MTVKGSPERRMEPSEERPWMLGPGVIQSAAEQETHARLITS